MMRMGFMATACIAVSLASGFAAAQLDARMVRYPDVSKDQIVFVYAGDVWLVAKEGGVAQRLSTPQGEESFPRFSPDGSQVAFTANYDGNDDVYVVDGGGGLPKRLTYHPYDDRVLDWTPDGASVLFASGRYSGRTRFNQIYRIAKEGGLPERLAVPYGEFASLAEDGVTLFYTPIARDFRTWKRYRGGMAPDIWEFNLTTLASRNLTVNTANDSIPMVHDGKLYFLSDRDENLRANVWVLDPPTGDARQLTFFEEMDVHFPSMGPEDIVLENGGRLYLLNLATEKLTEVEIRAITDNAHLKPHATAVGDTIQTATPSPSGKRAIFEARGDLFDVPAEHGVVLNRTATPGVAERYPALSPDGKTLAYFSDATGEYELTVRGLDERAAPRTVSSFGPGFRYRPQWSPDSTRVVFADQAMKIHLTEIESGKDTVIDQGLWMYHDTLSDFRVSWSGDSRWIAYSVDRENRNGVVYLYDTTNKERHAVTSGFYSATYPVFDPKGEYLFLITDQDFEPVYSDIDNTWIYPNTTRVAAIPLRKDVPSPLAPRNDTEDIAADDEKAGDDTPKNDDTAKADDDGDAGDKKDEDKDEKAEKKPDPVEIDMDGFEGRMVILPPEAGNYRNLAAVEGKVLFIREPRTGASGKDAPIVYYELEEREEKTVLPVVSGFQCTPDGKKLLVWHELKFAFVDIKEGQKLEPVMPTGECEAGVIPREEWRQIFNDVWRLERDFFYDPGMHGVNWEAMRTRYGALIDQAASRWDVSMIIGDLIAELNSSHTYRGGGDVEKPKTRSVGLLGADYTLENGYYRISAIATGAPWDAAGRAPLSEPGIGAKVGDYLLAVNGRPVDTKRSPYAAFDGLAGETIQLTLSETPSWENSREVLVKPATSEVRLRNLAWIEHNRKYVEEAGKGRIGYVYVPDTGRGGQTELVRMFAAQFTREALLIDERFNSGGQIPDRFVELLNRPITSYYAVRDGMDWQWPPVAHKGPKAMLINGWSGSGGDAFPYYFRFAGLGPLIGTRTWGGLIGISGAPNLIDGGSVTVPTFGIYTPEGKWVVEGYGVDPDIEVVDDPTALAQGRDPQLDRAIEELLTRLESNPPVTPEHEPYPDRSGR